MYLSRISCLFSKVIPKHGYQLLFCLLPCSLSVTKWIHLNWGDDGLITLFSKVWRLLRPVWHSIYSHLSPFIFYKEFSLLITQTIIRWRCDDQGGIFVLEPQPWDSYYKNRLVSEVLNFPIEAHSCCFFDVSLLAGIMLAKILCLLILQMTAMNYRNIKLHPDCFQEILLDKVMLPLVLLVFKTSRGSKFFE